MVVQLACVCVCICDRLQGVVVQLGGVCICGKAAARGSKTGGQ